MTGIKKRLGSLLGPQGPAGTEAANARFDEIERKSDNAVTRVEHIETMAGLGPGDVTDAQTANLITQEHTATKNALNAALGNTLVVVYHGRTRNYPRPATNRPVMWVGSVRPVNRAAGDLVPEASSEPVPYTPADLDLLAWWDPSTLTPGSTVTSIADKGPRGIDLTTVGGAGDITVTDTALALPGLYNSGSAYISTDVDAALGLWTGEVSVYMITALSTMPAVSNLFDNGSTFASRRAAFWVNSGGRVVITQGTAIQSDPYLVTEGMPVLISVTYTGGDDSRAELNGTVVTGPGDAGSQVPDSFRLFSNNLGANLANATIGDVIIARDVTEEQHTDVTEYLQAKWGLI